MTEWPELTIVIVNYNSGDYLAPCIEAIRVQTYKAYRVVVVDNASSDASLEILNDQPSVLVIRNDRNLGFAAAQNQGFGLSTSPFVMPLNFDIVMEPTFLERLVGTMKSSPRVGSATGKLLRMKGDGTRTNEIDNAGLLLSRGRFPIHRGLGEADNGQYGEQVAVFGAMGAAALYRRAMLDDIAVDGQFYDESYFMWYEDVDLDWRARLRGWECSYVPDAVAFHVGDPHGHGKSRLGAAISMRNRWRMILSNETSIDAMQNLPWILLEEFGLLKHVIRQRLLREYLGAFKSLLLSLSQVTDKRKHVQSRKVWESLPSYPRPLDEGTNAE